ncbi:alpha/beta-hydrolase [Tothia fuscella]|uniref:Alpha/beta-hydrolase n=1 Tax=Tothia fuscella TaxID=1048955 RepID=A0A9P4NPG7_9PEZI|nr:alpha/beta-hydrolase [Tothia fuscella]
MAPLSFFRYTGPPLALPPSITRTFIPSPNGQLELLSAEPPKNTTPRKTPLFFAHGGCGSAAVWIEYMSYLAQNHNIPCYAVSYRGHGASWSPWFLNMYFTTKRAFAEDLIEGVRFVREKEGRDVVLAAHSAGGALSQYALSEGIGDVRVEGLALLGAIPAYGSADVNWNWMKNDPWMVIRMFFKHFGNPMSPLSSTRLVKNAFFCDDCPNEKVAEFRKRTPPFESFAWPNGLMSRFASPIKILQRINGWGDGERLLVLAGEKDIMVTVKINEKSTEEYRDAFKELVQIKKIDAKIEHVTEVDDSESRGEGVVLSIVKGAGHHMQNDLQWEDGVERLYRFYDQL